MKPPPFRYERAQSVDAAVDFLAAEGERAKVIAGGQSLAALMNLRLARPEMLLDIGPLDELRHFESTDGALRVGAMTTQAELASDDAIALGTPLLAEAIPHIGHAAIRNRGTVGGTIAHADPAAELPVVLAALGGSVTLRSAGGERTLNAAEFFRGFLMTATEPNELLTAVSFPIAEKGAGYAFEEYSRRPGDFALVAVACKIGRDGDAVSSATIAVGGVGSTPLLVGGLDAVSGLSGEDAAARAGEIASGAVEPASDIHGSAEYRKHLTRGLVTRAVRRAVEAG